MGESQLRPCGDGSGLGRRVGFFRLSLVRCFLAKNPDWTLLRVGWSADMQNEELFRVFEYGAM